MARRKRDRVVTERKKCGVKPGTKFTEEHKARISKTLRERYALIKKLLEQHEANAA